MFFLGDNDTQKGRLASSRQFRTEGLGVFGLIVFSRVAPKTLRSDRLRGELCAISRGILSEKVGDMWRKKPARKHWTFWITMAFVLACDQVTKAMVERFIPLYESIPVIGGLFNIIHVKNTGVAFGLFAGDISPFRTVFFIGITIVALIVIFLIFRRIKGDRFLVPLSLGMIMAGAVGNLVDRIRWGYVVDFLDVYWHDFHWPAFNVADSAITVGVLLLLIENLFLSREKDGSGEVTRSA